MNLDLTGKRAVVCGSTQGIGKASAVELALLGASVTLLSRNEEKLKLVVQELKQLSAGDHNYVVADFGDPTDVKKKSASIAALYPVHILVNNTGGPPAGPAIDASIDERKNHQCDFNIGKNSDQRTRCFQYHSWCGSELVENARYRTCSIWYYGKQCAARREPDGPAEVDHSWQGREDREVA
jgi:NAD(P)-dependent dehydrogenase (short-subunit alcohol dehydrogenase family)